MNKLYRYMGLLADQLESPSGKNGGRRLKGTRAKGNVRNRIKMASASRLHNSQRRAAGKVKR